MLWHLNTASILRGREITFGGYLSPIDPFHTDLLNRINAFTFGVKSGANPGQPRSRYIQVNIRVLTLLARWVRPTCIQVRYVLKMAMRSQTWSDEEVLALLDIWTGSIQERSRVPTDRERAGGSWLAAQCKAVPQEAESIEEEV